MLSISASLHYCDTNVDFLANRRKTNALGKWDGNRGLSETVIRTNLHIKQVFVRIEIAAR